MNEREINIQELREELNKKHNTKLTDEQVDNWVGSDTPNSGIKELYLEVKYNAPVALTPDDVLDLWDAASDEVAAFVG